MDTMILDVESLWETPPTSTGPAGDPREALLDAVVSLHASTADYHPAYHVMWLAGIDVPETTSEQPLPMIVAVLRRLAHTEREEARTDTQQQVEDLLTQWNLPAGAVAEALSVTRQTIYLWRAGEEPKPVNADRLRELHRQVAQACGTRTGKDARKHLTKPSLRTGFTRLQEIGKNIDREHPLPQPMFTAAHYLSGDDTDLPVVARKPTIRIAKARPIKSVRSTK